MEMMKGMAAGDEKARGKLLCCDNKNEQHLVFSVKVKVLMAGKRFICCHMQ